MFYPHKVHKTLNVNQKWSALRSHHSTRLKFCTHHSLFQQNRLHKQKIRISNNVNFAHLIYYTNFGCASEDDLIYFSGCMGWRPRCLPEIWSNSRSNDLIGRVIICLLSTAEAAENAKWDFSATVFHKIILSIYRGGRKKRHCPTFIW